MIISYYRNFLQPRIDRGYQYEAVKIIGVMRGSLISFFNFTIALYNVKYTKYTTKVQQNSFKKEKKDKVLRRK
jgi:hypothetical protein